MSLKGRPGAHRRAEKLGRLAALAPLLLACVAPVAAREGLPWMPAAPTRVALDYRWLDSAGVEGLPSAGTEGSRATISGGFRRDDGASLSAGHSYDALDASLPDSAALPTNGDLHTLHLAAGWEGEWAGGALSLALAPAIATSSNAMKEPGDWRGEMLQWWGSVLYARPLSGRARGAEWLAGVARDYRFGEGRSYPVLGLRWRGERGRVRLAYPDLLLERELGAGWAVAFTTTPEGNQWRVYESDLEDGRDLEREGWRSELRLRWRWRERVDVAASLGYLWDRRWDYPTTGGREVSLAVDDGATLGLHLRWRAVKPRAP